MQKIKDKKLGISLTASIAELYEAQKHYFAAFIVYWFLFETGRRDEYKNKLDEMKYKIYESTELDFDPVINDIFSHEEIRYLGILPENHYREFETTFLNLQKNEKEGINSIDTGDDVQYQSVGRGIGMEWRQIISDEERRIRLKNKKQITFTVDTSVWNEIKTSELLDFISSFKEQDKNPDEIKLADLIESFLKKYQPVDKLEK